MVLPVVVIAGRPNVGKSTLFNRLAGRRSALVADTPGVTRDRKEAEALLRGRTVRLGDTPGLEEAAPETIAGEFDVWEVFGEAIVPIIGDDVKVGEGSRLKEVIALPGAEIPARSVLIGAIAAARG